MKKIFSVIVLIMFIASVNLTAQAYQRRGTLPKSEMALGGIAFYTDSDVVAKIYGEANWESTHECTYGKDIRLTFMETELCDILVTGNNGWKTPSGIGVGTSVNELVKKYGEPYLSKSYGNKRVYCYCSGGDAYYPDDPFLFFLFDKNDKKITKILLSGRPLFEKEKSLASDPVWEILPKINRCIKWGFIGLLEINEKTYEKL